MSDSDGTSSGDAQLFAIFSFAFLLLFLIPATIWRVCSGGGAKVDVVQPWKKVRAQRDTLNLQGMRAEGTQICMNTHHAAHTYPKIDAVHGMGHA